MAAPGMRAGVQITQTTGIRMTQQMQQAIGLLHLSTIELSQRILEEVEKNPLLEVEEKEESNEISLESIAERERSQDADNDIYNNDSSNNDIDGKEGLYEINENGAVTEKTENEYLSSDSDPYHDSDRSSSQETGSDSMSDYQTDSYSAGERSKSRGLGDIDDSVYEGETTETLFDHLMFQLEMSPLTDSDKLIAEMIIDSVDNAGYLNDSAQSIADSLKDRIEGICEDDVVAVLKLIQHFDPLGVAARSVSECLTIQLNELEQSSTRDFAIQTVSKHIDLLEKHDYKTLRQRLSVSEEELKNIILLIKTLNPRPGSIKLSKKSEYVVPDVIVFKNRNNQYEAVLNHTLLPTVKVSSFYRSMANHAKSKEDKTYFKEKEKDANWIINAVKQRNDTLQQVADTIIEEQAEFLEKGEAYMKPLILKDVAEKLNYNESTISRITTEKYMQTPRGTFELKKFFSAKLATADGDSASATAVKALLKELIEKEDKRKPLSDDKMTDLLVAKGIQIKRRTVAKYRDELNIPTASKRKAIV